MAGLLARLGRRLRGLVRRAEREHAMAEEMRHHIEMEAAALQREGLSADDALRQARIAFGGVERFKEEGRDAFGTRLLADLGQDFGYAMRQLRASPGFAAATILTLALGIGATVTMDGFRRYINSQETTLSSPERLVLLGQGQPACSRCSRMAAGNYLTVRDRSQTLESVSMFTDWDPVLRGTDRAELLDGVEVSSEFFRTLDIHPMLGRTIGPGDSLPDRRQVVVLSERMWRDRFQSDSGVLGRLLVLDRTPYAIVGVVANAVSYPRDTDLWAPLVLNPADSDERAQTGYRVIGRLSPEASAETVSAELAFVGGQLAAAFPTVMGGSTLHATPVAALNSGGDAQTSINAAAVWLVLLVACINLAGLLIARLSARRRELAVRRAMGAAPGRILRQLIVETMLVTVLGGAGGAVVAIWGLAAQIGWSNVRFDGRVFGLALAMGLLSGLVIGLWPALRFARPTLTHELRDQAGTGSADAARGRRVLVAAQVALAIVLLSAAGLLARSFQRMYAYEPGFRADSVLAVRVYAPPPGAPDRIERMVAAIEAVPGVERAGATLGLPFGHGWSMAGFDIDGRAPLERPPRVRMQAATPGYFATLGIPLVHGRAFVPGDRAGAPRVAIINQALAERYFPDEAPIGRAVVIDSVRWEIVGVAGTVFTGNFEELVAPEIYRPVTQWDQARIWIVARTRGEPEQLGPAIAAALRQLDPDIAVTRQMSMRALRAADMSSERMMLGLMARSALAALLISAMGLYGLISYSVGQRTREFGVRLALGAQRRAVLGLVLGQGVRLAAIGAVLGVAGALATTRAMQSLLFQVSPADPLTLIAVVVVIGAVALLAAFVPARRAMQVDPMTSLREE